VSPAPAAVAQEAGQGKSRGRPDFNSLPEDVRRRILERYDKNGDGRLDESERAAMREAGGGRPGGRRPGESASGGGEGAASAAGPKTVYIIDEADVIDGQGSGELRAISVTTGISDGAFTEVVSGIGAGTNVVTGTVVVEVPTKQTTNPFSPMRPKRGPSKR